MAVRAADLSDTELDKREDACLDAFHQLLTSAHFRLLSPEDWATAQADAFTARAPASGLQDCRGGGRGGGTLLGQCCPSALNKQPADGGGSKRVGSFMEPARSIDDGARRRVD